MFRRVGRQAGHRASVSSVALIDYHNNFIACLCIQFKQVSPYHIRFALKANYIDRFEECVTRWGYNRSLPFKTLRDTKRFLKIMLWNSPMILMTGLKMKAVWKIPTAHTKKIIYLTVFNLLLLYLNEAKMSFKFRALRSYYDVTLVKPTTLEKSLVCCLLLVWKFSFYHLGDAFIKGNLQMMKNTGDLLHKSQQNSRKFQEKA